MKIEIHVHHHTAENKAILALLQKLNQKADTTMTDLTRLTEEVEQNTTVIQGAITLIEGLAQEIRDNATDPAALEELALRLDSNSNALAAAVDANTQPSGDEEA